MPKNYDPRLIAVGFAGIELQAYAPDEFAVSERNEDGYSVVVGARGRVTRVKNNNETGKVTIRLLADAPENDLLTAKYRAGQLLPGADMGDLMVKNLNGTELCHARQAWIMKLPTISYGTDGPVREWVFECEKLDVNPGGSFV